MSNVQKLMVAVTVLIACWESSHALNCYECKFCNQPRNNVTCSSDTISCYTDTTSILGYNMTWRGCSTNYNATCQTKLNKWSFDGIKSCWCKDDMCNSDVFSHAGPSACASATVVVLLMAASALFY